MGVIVRTIPRSNETELATITFDVADGTTGSTGISIDVNSTAAGFSFDGQPHDVVISAESQPDPVSSVLSIDSATGAVTLNVDPDFEDVPEYAFEIVSSNDRNASGTASINNLDEVAPTITSGSDAGSVDENGAAQVVYTATADDSGDISGGVIFSLSSDEDASAFSIDAASGEVTFAGGADYETQSEYIFSFIATDAAGNSSAPKYVSLSINNLDEAAPTITSGSDAGSIDENGATQVVYTATADDSGDISGGVIFSLSNDSDSAFSIDSASGDVTFAGGADYEAQAEYSFGVIATDAAGNSSAPESVSLSINNLDEVAPTITSGPDSQPIFENGLAQIIYTATADDSGDISGGVTFSLSNDSDSAFSIDAASGEVIYFAGADSETQSEYNFEVIATDAAGISSEPWSVSVSVAEQGFEISSASNINVDENIGENQPVYAVEVLGVEEGDNITYSLPTSLEHTVGSFEQRFVENDDGSITLQLFVSPTVSDNYLDGIENFDFNLSFNPSEITGVNPSISSEATLSLYNDDIDGEISFAAIFFPAAVSVDVPLVEVTFDLNTDLASTSFVVSNSNINADVYSEQSVASYYNNRDFTINEATGEVSLIENPDHESRIEYIFTVLATNTTTNEIDIQAVNLEINDIDDYRPTITSGDIVNSIDENSGAQVIYTVTADDSGDISDGFTFALGGPDAEALSVSNNLNDGTFGQVTLNEDPNYEEQAEYSFTVIAIDAAGNESDAKELTLSVNNLDDTAPTFTSSDDAGSIDENGSAQIVYTATADDSGDISGGMTFGLAEGGDSAFSINADSGEVTFAGDADYENKTIYTFDVFATDAAGNASTQTVVLSVDNLDEVAPTITSDATVPGIVENTGAGQVVYTATADDSADISEGFGFSLAGDDADSFEIDENTGVVRLVADPDFEAKSEYNFAVVATDFAGNASNMKSLTMNVSNVDEVGPTITSASEADSILENSGAGQLVYTATAEDTDFNNEEIIQYSLANSSDDVFSINEVTGEVILNVDPDYEANALFSFTVIATDGSGNESLSKTVSLTIDDVDDFTQVGAVYHWASRKLMEDVSINMLMSDGTVKTDVSDENGEYHFSDLAGGDVVITAVKDLQPQGRTITSADALAVLKMAVGINPNGTSDISPYQFIAADVNRSGRNY